MKATDTSIDHRRVPNLQTFMKRKGTVLPISKDRNDYKPGEIVTWSLTKGQPHIGLVSAKKSLWGTPLIVHNIGNGAHLDDILFAFRITGHYKYGLAS